MELMHRLHARIRFGEWAGARCALGRTHGRFPGSREAIEALQVAGLLVGDGLAGGGGGARLPTLFERQTAQRHRYRG